MRLEPAQPGFAWGWPITLGLRPFTEMLQAKPGVAMDLLRTGTAQTTPCMKLAGDATASYCREAAGAAQLVMRL